MANPPTSTSVGWAVIVGLTGGMKMWYNKGGQWATPHGGLAPKIRNACRTLGRRVGRQQKNPKCMQQNGVYRMEL